MVVIAAAVILFPKPGFGQQDRRVLARQTVQTYWGDIGHGKTRAAYALMTSGNQQARPFTQYSQDMYGFLTHMNSLSVTVSQVQVNGDQATARVALYSVLSPTPLRAWQHLFWENGPWRLIDANGGMAPQK